MILKKKVMCITALLLVVIIIALIGSPKDDTAAVSAKLNVKPQIILDAGHAALENTIK